MKFAYAKFKNSSVINYLLRLGPPANRIAGYGWEVPPGL
jgi:hypothetical protein